MKRFLLFALAAFAFIAIPACETINRASNALGFDVEWPDVYAGAETLDEQVYLSTGLFIATTRAAAVACRPTDRPEVLDKPCAKAADISERLQPGVNALIDANAAFVEARAALAGAEGKPITDPATVAAYGLALLTLTQNYEAIRTEIEAFVNGKY